MLLRTALVVLVALLAVAVPALSSQTLYTIHGGTPATATVTELKGPPGLPLGYPGGPVVSSFATTSPFACPTVGPLAPPPFGVLGDVAFDTVGDVAWATDGLTITSYSPAGAPIVSFPVPAPLGPLTGLGFNSAAGVLIMTDGALIAGAITFGAGCVVPIVGPGLIPSPAPGLLTDIEWDPLSGTFFGCDTLGFVTNIGPVGGVGPFGIFPAAGLCAPGLMPSLRGLAVDTTVAGVPVLYVTDGFVINRLSPPGVVAAPTFYTPAPCFPVLTAGPLSGLGFSLHGVTFSLPCHTEGGLLPMITSTGNSTEDGAMTLGLVAPAPPGPLILLISFALGPPFLFDGCTIVTVPATMLTLPALPGGVIAFGIPPAWPAGTTVYFQWVYFSRGGFAITPGLGITVGLP